ncbi:hypothetical protein SH661x_000676 [Planctomicrobium sp. SH661]|uniref:beta strand repeat-containing protein n=1 Tax=Planctomicrobium sp. SH661 TaxID=3448124 RepID=UPI003F5B31FF
MSVRRSPVFSHRDTPVAFRKRRWGWSLAGLLAAANLWQGPQSLLAQEPPPAPVAANEAYTLPSQDLSGSAAYPGISFPSFNYPTYPDEPPVVGGYGVKGRAAVAAGTTVGQSQPINAFDISPYLFEGNLYLFGEGRIALGNDGKTGGSLGAGGRYFFPQTNSILGASGWWDIDATRGPTFRQWGVNMELLSEFLDVRGNIYAPYGEITKVTSQRFEPGSQAFIDRPPADVLPGEAQGTYLSFQRRIFSATALQGFDTLFSIPMPGQFARSINLETSAGFYGYEANDGSVDQTYGWRLRFDVDLFERLSHMFLEINNDKTFKTNVAFMADINYWGKLEHRPRLGHSQYNRLADWVRRNRTVVALESSVLNAPEIAINPNTGRAYVVYQVLQTDEISHGGNGTIGNPFQNLQDAIDATGTSLPGRPSDFIHFVQGNSIIESGINIGPGLDGVRVIGEQDNPSIGIPVAGLNSNIFLPTVTPIPFNAPIIQNVVGTNAVTISSNNTTFAAINIANVTGGDAIFAGAGVNGASIQNVNITTVNGGNGINLVGTTGNFTFNNVVIEDIEETAFQVLGGNPRVQFAGISEIDNTANSHPSHGFAVNIQDTSPGSSVDMRSLVINDTGGKGIRVYGTAPGSSNAAVAFGTTTLTNTVVDAPLPGDVANAAVYIKNHASAVTFNDVLTINGIDAILGGDSIAIEGLQAGGSVFANAAVNITGRRGHGIYVVDSGDSGGGALNPASINFSQQVTINGLGAGFVDDDSAVLYQSNSGSLIFGNGLNITDSLGDGVEVTSGIAAPVGTDRGLVQVIGGNITGVSGAGGATGVSFHVHDITKANFGVVTGGLNINNRGDAASTGLIGAGVRVVNYAGTAAFGGTTTVNNQLGTFANAVEILDNAATSSIGFTTLNVNNQLGAGSYGVRVVNNLNTVAGVSFGQLNVTTTDATGVSFEDNGLVTIGSGTLSSTGARAIEVFTNGGVTPVQQHAIQLTSVSASGSDYGIFVNNSRGTFIVTGDLVNAGSGGTITGMTSAGAFFQNTQLASLSSMNLNGNEIGVEAIRLLPRVGVQNGLFLNQMSITASASEGIYAQDVSNFSLSNSDVSGNGITNSQEQIELLATVGAFDSNNDGVTEVVSYNFAFDNNNIADGATLISGTDMIYIHTAPAISNAVPLTLSFTNNGSPLSTTNTNSISANRNGGSAAVDVNWVGATDVNIVNNQFATGNGANAIGLDFTINGPANINYVNNGLQAIGAGATGIRTNFSQAATLTISGNQVLNNNNFPISGGGFIFSGLNSTGLDLTFLASGNIVNINNNSMEFTDFGSRAIVFPRIVGAGGNTRVGIGGNTISRVVNFNDAFTEHGVWFQVVQGTVLLNGAAGSNTIFSNNQIVAPFEPFWYDFQMPAGASAGTQIQINGNFWP